MLCARAQAYSVVLVGFGAARDTTMSASDDAKGEQSEGTPETACVARSVPLFFSFLFFLSPYGPKGG